jgi:Zn-dependent peptidase ImmA (M78 family)
MSFAALAESLRSARERSGLSQAVAAESLKISRVMLSYYESAERPIPFQVVVGACRLYGLKADQLIAGIEEAESTIDPRSVLMRSAPSTIDTTSEAAFGTFARYIGGYVELAHLLGTHLNGQVSPFKAVEGRVSKREVARLARDLRQHLGLGVGALGDLFAILDDRLLVFRLPLGNATTAPSGFFYNHPQAGFCVVVNSSMTLGRQIFTLAHELGHAYFHSPARDVWISIQGAAEVHERFCDDFASEFLIPEDALSHALSDLAAWEHLSDPLIAVQLMHRFGVSYAATLVRLRQLNLIDEASYADLVQIQPGAVSRAVGLSVHRADATDAKLSPLERFPRRLLSLVLEALREGVVSENAASELLGLSRPDIRFLLSPPAADELALEALRDYEQTIRK